MKNLVRYEAWWMSGHCNASPSGEVTRNNTNNAASNKWSRVLWSKAVATAVPVEMQLEAKLKLNALGPRGGLSIAGLCSGRVWGNNSGNLCYLSQKTNGISSFIQGLKSSYRQARCIASVVMCVIYICWWLCKSYRHHHFLCESLCRVCAYKGQLKSSSKITSV